MGKLTRLAVLGTVAAVVGALSFGVPASAAPAGSSYTCTGGTISSGTYGSITVTGACTVQAGATITVTGNITVAAGAVFDAQGAPSQITVGHNVTGAPGLMVGLGCTPAHGGCASASPIVVNGNITLDRVYDAALNGITVMGNVTSTGGGAGLSMDQFIPFSVKDDTIHGNLTVTGLTTTWFGVIRTTVDGNVTLTDITLADPDGNEIVHDTVGRNLSCFGMSPAPQFGDAVEDNPDPAYPFSTVGRHALGQCAFVLAH